jgi:hypothetical protein
MNEAILIGEIETLVIGLIGAYIAYRWAKSHEMKKRLKNGGTGHVTPSA